MGSSVILPPAGQPKTGPDPTFVAGSVPNFTEFGFKNISPPSFVYLQKDDQIVLVAASNQAGESVQFTIRHLPTPFPAGGQPDAPTDYSKKPAPFTSNIILPEVEIITLGSLRGGATKTVVLQEGFLLSINANPTLANQRGQTIVRATLARNVGGVQAGFLVLFHDYTFSLNPAGWPYGRVLHAPEGPGWLHSIQIANPAAGADFSFTVPGNSRLRPITLEAQLAVANSGAARPVELVVDDGANIVARMAANTAAPINATANVNFSNAGTPSTAIPSDLYAQMPSAMILPGAFRMRSITTNIVAGDQWSNIWFLAEEWLDAL